MARLNHKYDVVIIGAGPVGIYTSIKLAEKGFRILVLEEDKEIGKKWFKNEDLPISSLKFIAIKK